MGQIEECQKAAQSLDGTADMCVGSLRRTRRQAVTHQVHQDLLEDLDEGDRDQSTVEERLGLTFL